MRVETLHLQNIKCFEDITLRFGSEEAPRNWVTLLGENGCGKTTALQALALSFVGSESAIALLPNPVEWLRDKSEVGILSFSAGYPSYTRRMRFQQRWLTSILDKEPGELLETEEIVVAYGAFRRLSVVSAGDLLPPLERKIENLTSLFDPERSVLDVEAWIRSLDYRVLKANDQKAKRMMDQGIAAINQLLPDGVHFDKVDDEGRVLFVANGVTGLRLSQLSDGYRSMLALAGDIVWRLMQAYSESENPMHEAGVVLIDELDIHLHPRWQREIAGWLRKQFPNLQFIVVTHSPLIAMSAGEDALTLKFDIAKGKVIVREIDGIEAMNVDRALTSPAFGLDSPYAPDTQSKIDRYDALLKKGTKRTAQEEGDYQTLRAFIANARPFGGPPEPGSLEARIEAYLDKVVP